MRILCLPYTHTLSHLSRPLVVAKELRRRGHEVIFAGSSPKEHFIREEGFEVLSLDQLDPQVLFGRIQKGELQFVKNEELLKMIDDDRELFRTVEPDLVLSDGRFSAPISTALEGVNHAAIVNVSSTEYRALPYIPFFEWIPPAVVKRDSRLWKALDLLNLKLERAVFDNASALFKKLSKKHGLQKKVTATNCLAGKDLTLLADIEEYFPTRNLPADNHYVGPLTWESPLGPPAWWPPQKNRTLAYITMGTTWMGGSFSALYDMLKRHGITAVVATGGQLKGGEAERLKTVEGEIYVEDFINGDLVMQECDIVVCHGGNGTIYQALQNGTPIIGIPTIPDQEFNMRRVEALGIGRRLAMKDFEEKPEKLFDLIRSVAEDPSYRKNAQRLQNRLAELQPAKKAADLIDEAFLKPS